MNTSEIQQSTGSAKSEPPQNESEPKYNLNESLLMLNSALRYLGQSGVKVTLQRTEIGVVLTLQGVGVMQKPNGATRLVPISDTTPLATSPSL